jgi:rhomboid protease GluP
MGIVILLLAVFVIAHRAMTPEDRARFNRAGVRLLQRVREAVTLRHRELESFHQMLDARTRLAPVTPVLTAANIVVFVLILVGSHPLGDPNTLLAWGGNFGPRTANGEWWRLTAALFVHAGWLHLLANVIGLVQLGLVLERLVGPLAFTAVYFATGLLSGVAHVSTSPVTVYVGASGAIFGIYGLMLASLLMGGLVRGTRAGIPLALLKRLAPAAAVFVIYHLATDTVTSATQLSGLLSGFACGLVIAWRVSEQRASVPRIAAATAAVVAGAVIVAAPLRGMVDVKSELQRLVMVEERTATTFRTALDQFDHGRMTAEALAEVIEGAILSDVNAARARVESLDSIPLQQQPLVAAGKEYLRLRDESWRVRSAALRRASMPMLREADTLERASRDILRQISPS